MALPLALPLSLPSLLPSALPLQEYTVTSIVRSIVKFIAIYAGNVTLTAHSARHQRARFSRTPPIHTSSILIIYIYKIHWIYPEISRIKFGIRRTPFTSFGNPKNTWEGCKFHVVRRNISQNFFGPPLPQIFQG